MIGESLELRSLLRNRTLAPHALRALQVRKLRAAVHRAYEQVPYYRSLFRSAGLSTADIRTPEDLRHLPVTTKSELRAAGVENITARDVDLSGCIVRWTSGSTGHPFTVYLTKREARTRRLLEFRALLAIGFRPRDRLAVLGAEGRQPRVHHRLRLYQTEVISPFLTLEEQRARLLRIRPTVLWAYPTALRALLHGFRPHGVEPRLIVTSAQACDVLLREKLRSEFHAAEHFNFYGAIEVGRIATECPAHRGLHLNADNVIMEILPGTGLGGDGRSGAVALTSLNNSAMPLLRYRLGDRCSMMAGEVCSCGSSFPLIAPPEGREHDVIRLSSGRQVSPLGLQALLKLLPDIEQFRLTQESIGHLVLELVLPRRPDDGSLSRLRSRLIDHLQDPVRLDIQLVDSIPENGAKFKDFISHLPPEQPVVEGAWQV